MARVLIVASGTLERTGLAALVGGAAGHHVVGSLAPDPPAIADALEREQPDVLLISGDADEDAIAGVLAGAGPPAVVLTDGAAASAATDLLRLGARGVLPRSASSAEIVAAVGAVAAGLVALHPDATGGVAPAAPTAAPRTATSPIGQRLTAREVEVLEMLAEGLGNKEIAWRLGISDHTVKFHIASIFTKLDVSTRTEAVTVGIRRGLIML
jgi:DNA-binding NarL/FixJ family response regulator